MPGALKFSAGGGNARDSPTVVKAIQKIFGGPSKKFSLGGGNDNSKAKRIPVPHRGLTPISMVVSNFAATRHADIMQAISMCCNTTNRLTIR